jgi:hypothetical protein
MIQTGREDDRRPRFAGQVTVETPAKSDDIDEQRVWLRLAVNIGDGSVAGRDESCGSSNLL